MRIWLDIDGKDPPTGRAGNGRREERFGGWLDLMGVLSLMIDEPEPSRGEVVDSSGGRPRVSPDRGVPDPERRAR